MIKMKNLSQSIFNFVNICWLIWLSLRYMEHEVSIAKINEHLHYETRSELFDFDDSFSLINEKVSTTEDEPSLEPRSRSRSHSLSDSEPGSQTKPKSKNFKKYQSSFVPYSQYYNSFEKPENQKRRRITQQQQIEHHNNTSSFSSPSTKCILTSYENSTSQIFPSTNHYSYNNSMKNNSFNLSLELLTDLYADETSWNFYQIINKREEEKEEREILFDFDDKDHLNLTGSEIAKNNLHIYKYSCFTDYIDDNDKDKNEFYGEEICYEFEMIDKWHDGNCCWGGHGLYNLSLNDNFDTKSTTLAHGRFYAYVDITPFCVDGTGRYIPEENNDTAAGLLYPSRECLNERCYCDSEPNLLSNFDDIETKYPNLHALKTRTLMNIMILSGPTTVHDINSPQYKAACWVLNDDPYLTQYSNATAVHASDAEKRMMQRYILGVHYFSTNPHKWKMYLNFLSSKTECEWYTFDDISEPIGIGCDENNNIISILFRDVNIEGPLMDEISGLKSLEFLAIVKEPLIHGTIPSSMGLLSELKYLTLEKSPFEGRIPEEIFNPSKFERLMIVGTECTGTIPSSIGKMVNLQVLKLHSNNLSGEIPSAISQLTKLRSIELYENHFKGTIPDISKLKELKGVQLHDNELTGTIPSELGLLTRLHSVMFSKNNLSGTIPSSIKYLTNIKNLDLIQTNLEGEIPQELCDLEELPKIRSDCRNDVFQPSQSCSCCSYCTDETPTWNGNCPDSKLKITIDHVEDGEYFTSLLLEWSITDAATNRRIMSDGPYTKGITRKPSYESCIAVSDCFVLNMSAKPIKDVHIYPEHSDIGWKTNYSLYWDDELILRDAFENGIDKAVVMPEITFHYDEERDRVEVIRDGSSQCPTKNITCNDEVIFLYDQQHILYNEALKVSGSDKFDDPLSPQTKALCWVLKNTTYFETLEFFNADEVKYQTSTKVERYILTLLHLTSRYKIFGNGEYPPDSYHCEWKGVSCDIKEFIHVTSICLNHETKQIIGGPMIHELGSLPYLEKLVLSQTGLKGTIPEVYSNLWSLMKIDLSRNDITGKIPDTFFRQLEKLEYLDLSDNALSKEIPKDIGSYSSIRHLSLGGNQLTGSVPLDGFNMFNLEHFNVSNNLLREIEFPLLLKHPNMKILNIGSNYFVGSLQNDTFKVLKELEYFNISENEISGTIPSSFPQTRYEIYEHSHNTELVPILPKLTHFDIHDNRLKGFVPSELAELQKIEHLNLQGNKLTGSIPSQLNNLTQLSVLALSHNQLKGNIPLNLTSLENIKYLHLHANKLSGKAPRANNKMESYITDCGYPSASSDPVACPSCNICCNKDGGCQMKPKSRIRPIIATVIFIFSIFGFIAILYIFKDAITNSKCLKSFFEDTVNEWNGMLLINNKSVYHFFLHNKKTGWCIAFLCGIVQIMTLFLFINAANIESASSDWKYTMVCSSKSLDCEDSRAVNLYGYSIFALVLAVWLLRDMISTLKLLLLALQKKSPDFLFTSGFVLLITLLSAWTSIYYNQAIATKNTDMIVNTVILLFVVELDEILYELAEIINEKWIEGIVNKMRKSAAQDIDSDLLLKTLASMNIKRGISKKYQSFRMSVNPSGKSFRMAKVVDRVMEEEKKKTDVIKIIQEKNNNDNMKKKDESEAVPLISRFLNPYPLEVFVEEGEEESSESVESYDDVEKNKHDNERLPIVEEGESSESSTINESDLDSYDEMQKGIKKNDGMTKKDEKDKKKQSSDEDTNNSLRSDSLDRL